MIKERVGIQTVEASTLYTAPPLPQSIFGSVNEVTNAASLARRRAGVSMIALQAVAERDGDDARRVGGDVSRGKGILVQSSVKDGWLSGAVCPVGMHLDEEDAVEVKTMVDVDEVNVCGWGMMVLMRGLSVRGKLGKEGECRDW
jgi:hypothetical protein